MNAPVAESEFRLEKGYYWPKGDRHCAAIIFSHAQCLHDALQFVTKRDVVVQAGGNCGVWPVELAKSFGAVYTFEPDHENFACLAMNTRSLPNVFKFQAALGDAPGGVSLLYEQANCGATRVGELGPIPTLRIDDLGLRACDLIYLDIEGRELAAVVGAHNTIAEFLPVIVVEDKGISANYGVPKGGVVQWLQSRFGYTVAAQFSWDSVLVPPGHPSLG